MLVLTRKAGEKIIIDGGITVEVVKVQGNRVTLGIQAPRDVKIMRSELNQPQVTSQIVEVMVEGGFVVAC